MTPDDRAQMNDRPEDASDAPALEPAGLRRIPVMRPQLPPARALLPWLEQIDRNRIYSNFGPLALEFEAGLARELGLDAAQVSSAATGTAGLMGAILALAGAGRPERPLALMPAFSFVATAVAAERCGYTPLLADVDPDTWLLEPEKLATHAQLDRIGVVMPVSAFGRPVAQAPWQEFSERTGIPVVIDAAAAFESISDDPAGCLGPIPVVLSLHATKSLGIGEGGAIACRDADLVGRIGEALNFGFHATRDSVAAGSNGKLSEYHAAVGLAVLDGWDAHRRSLCDVAAAYRRHAQAAGLGARLITAPDICSSYALFRCTDAAESLRVQRSLQRHAVEFRLWYGLGIHRQTYFSRCPADPLPVTDAISPCLLGLPMANDLEDAAVARVMRGLREGVDATGT